MQKLDREICLCGLSKSILALKFNKYLYSLFVFNIFECLKYSNQFNVLC